ncbi:ATP-binding cassette domain-containing protein [Rhizobium sullae]|uniref:ABC transporter domain-containing protein n=1 Tax=Rhizobium sullae TaxID=50338 RepID=A0A2N0DDI3_RHISU|nr:hypothetical protein CWR43_07605 [Rhizobium sullae]
MKAPSVRIHDLTLTYRRHPAVHHLSGAFKAGSLTAIVGPNGAGKSTLLKGIVGALRPDSGRIHLDGVKRHDIGYLPQLMFSLALLFRPLVAECLDSGFLRSVSGAGGFIHLAFLILASFIQQSTTLRLKNIRSRNFLSTH